MQWRHLLTAHPELVLEPDGEVQVVMKENQRLLSAIGADSKAAAGGYAGPQLWGMYKKTCDELQKHQKENQKTKESLNEQLHWAQSTLAALQSEAEELRKENKRQKQRIQHRDQKLMVLAQEGHYVPDDEEGNVPCGAKSQQKTQPDADTHRPTSAAAKAAAQAAAAAAELFDGERRRLEEDVARLQKEVDALEAEVRHLKGGEGPGPTDEDEEAKREMRGEVERLREDKRLQATVLQELRRKVCASACACDDGGVSVQACE
jgi:DNA repair exonuclease SbcCD ATPase subunit